MKKGLIVTVMAAGLTFAGAFSASAANPCGKSIDLEVFREYKQEANPLLAALQAKEIELSEADTYGISETYITQTPDIAKINALESDIEFLKDKISAAATKYGVAVCCRF